MEEHLASLAGLVEGNEAALALLNDPRMGHSDVVEHLRASGIPTSERSVRRWRKEYQTFRVTEPVTSTPPVSVGEEPIHTEAAVRSGADVVRDLRAANRRLAISLGKARDSKIELVAAVYEAASDALTGLVIPEVPLPIARDVRTVPEEVAVAVLGDWQLAKITPTYGSETCEERIEAYGDKVVRITEIQRVDHPVRTLHVWLLGDIVEGELIFPGQQHLIDASLYRQVTVDGPRILGNFLRKMLANFETVHVTGVIGNHGALGGSSRREYSPETNADRMLYRIVQQIITDPRISWDIPDGGADRNWYAVDRIGNYSCMLFHGDQIRGGFAGFPYYGLAKKVWGWKSGAIEQDFDDVMFGHWHQNVEVTLNSVVARCNGSTESYNTYAQEQLASMGRPSQRLMFVNPVKGEVTAEYKVWLASGLYD